MVERKFEKKVQAHLYELVIKQEVARRQKRAKAKAEPKSKGKLKADVPKVMSRRALEKVVDKAARTYLAKLGCCPPGLLASDGDDKGEEWHGAFEEEVARAVRNSLAKQGIGPPTKPQAWLLEAKAAAKAKAAAAAAAAEAKLSTAGRSASGKAATGESGSNSIGSKANGSSKGAASSSSGARAVDAGAAPVANGAEASPADSGSAGADPAGRAAGTGTGAVRIYRDDSSSASTSSSSAVKRRSPSRPPAGASVSAVRNEAVQAADHNGRPPSGGGGKQVFTDAELEDRQRGIHEGLMKKWRNMKEEQDLGTEERTALMKAALYDALHWQRWLNGKADAAAIARRFEPPTSQPWRKRFRARKEGIIEHYRERMERVTAQADTSRHAESRGIPAVCTALAGARLLHLELEQDARAAGVTIPFMMTLDAQWAVEDSLSGEVDRMLSEELAPPPEPQTLREEFGKMFKNRLGRSDRRQSAEAPEAPGLRIINEVRAIPRHQEYIDLLKEAARLSEYWARQYEEFFVRKTLTRRSRLAKAAGEAEAAAAEPGPTSGGTTSIRPALRSTDAAAATAPSAGRVLQQMFGGMFGKRASEQAALTARPHWAPPVPLTAGGGVAYSPPRGAAAVPRPAPPSRPRVEAMLQWKRQARAAPGVASFVATRQREQELFELGYQRVAGIDDSGVGSAAGPIVAAACLMPLDVNPRGIRDSKDLNNSERVQVFEQMVADPRIAYSTCVVDAYVVDEVGGEAANMLAMYGAWRNLAAAQPDFVLIDGKGLPKVIDQLDASLAIPQGDRSDYVIAAASIIASVTRAKLMEQYARSWPQYNFERNWGHLDDLHRAALREHGACPIHRVSQAVAALSGGARLWEGGA